MKKTLILLSIFILAQTCATAEVSQVSLPNNDAKLEYNLGIDFYKIGQYDKAIASFREAINIDPDYIDAYYNLGTILEYLKQYDQALTVFKQIIVRQPEDYEAVYNAANLSYKLEQPQKAVTYISLIPKESVMYKKAQELLLINDPSMAKQISEANKVHPPETKLEEKPKDNTHIPNGVFQQAKSPTGMTSDSDGNLYYASFSENSIYKITPNGKKMLFLKSPQLDGPIDIIVDSLNNFYISNYNKNNVLKISNNGEVSVLITNIEKPYGLHIKDYVLFIAVQGTNSIVAFNLK